MTKDDYRILERKGLFHVQVRITKIKRSGWLWWRKETKEQGWVMCDVHGKQSLHIFRYGYLTETLEPFESLKKANDFVNLILTPDKIHTIS